MVYIKCEQMISATLKLFLAAGSCGLDCNIRLELKQCIVSNKVSATQAIMTQSLKND